MYGGRTKTKRGGGFWAFGRVWQFKYKSRDVEPSNKETSYLGVLYGGGGKMSKRKDSQEGGGGSTSRLK